MAKWFDGEGVGADNVHLGMKPNGGPENLFLHDASQHLLSSKVDDIIDQHIQPKQKYAYLGDFPSKIKDLDWLVKSMDRPKIDVEMVEQLRNNVVRYYPIKYNHGEISITFWDDRHNKTITTLYDHFSKAIWVHDAVAIRGTFMLRDSVVIPSFSIWELHEGTSAPSNQTISGIPTGATTKYTFENVLMSSYDFDSDEDETDDGVHTVQVTFKFERYSVSNVGYVEPKGAPNIFGSQIGW